MEDEVIGASIQVASFLMSILGVTLQRRAMIVDQEPDDEQLLVVPMDDDDDEENARNDDEETEIDRLIQSEEGMEDEGRARINSDWSSVVRGREQQHQQGTPSVSTATTPLSTGSISPPPGKVVEGHDHEDRCRHHPAPSTRAGCFCSKRFHCCYSRIGRNCSHISKMWLLGFCIFYLSQVVEVFALNFASQSTIVAVGSLSTFVNAIVAVRVFHEPFQFLPPRSERRLGKKLFKWDLFNLMFIVAGSVCTVIFAPRISDEEERSFNAEKLLHKWIEMPFFVFFIGSVVLVSTLLFRFFTIKRGPLVLAISLGTLNSFSITLTKIVTQLVNRNDLFNLKALVMISVWVGLLLLQVVLMQIGLRNFEQSGAFSISGVFGGAMTITSGMLYYKTYEDFPNQDNVIGFACGVSLMLYGILVFSQRKNLSREEMKRRLFADTIVLEEEDEQQALRTRLLSAGGTENNGATNDEHIPVYQTIVPAPHSSSYHRVSNADEGV